MKIVLGENRYGKAENRVVRVTRDGDTHELLDINVTSQLTGDQESTHYTGANDKVLPTDTQKNTDRKSTRLNSSHVSESRMPSSA